MKIIYFNYATVLILAVMLITAMYRRVGVRNGNREFILAVFEVLLTTLFDIGAVALDNAGAGHTAAKLVFHTGYLVCHTLSAFFYLLYLVSLTDTWYRAWYNRLFLITLLLPAVAYLMAMCAGFLGGPRILYIDENDVYTRGPAFFLNYLVAAIYLVYGVYYIIRHRRLFSTKWIITLFSPYPFILIATLVEFLMPTMIIELLFNATALLFVYINIQRPEELTDPITNLGNTAAYESYCKRVYFNKKPMHLLAADVGNYAAIRATLDYEGNREFLRGISSDLIDLTDNLHLSAEIFYNQAGRFFMFIPPFAGDRLEEAAARMLSLMNAPRLCDQVEISPETTVFVVNVPEDIPDFAGFLRFGNKDFSGLSTRRIVRASRLFSESRGRLFLDIDRVVTEAIEKQRMEVYYQPIWSTTEQRFLSAEALLRIRDPEFGFVAPDIFITAAEQSGEINRVWDFVLSSVCDFIRSPEFTALGLEYIEVNLSPVQCLQEHLADRILSELDTRGVPHDRISLEVTETALVRNPEALINTLNQLHKAGIRLCLDDYGTGYSNTRRILELPLDIVKLDKSFVDGLDSDRIHLVVADSIRMLRNIGLRVVAEGVETETALTTLTDADCDMIQGYYFSRPIPRSEFITFCQNQ